VTIEGQRYAIRSDMEPAQVRQLALHVDNIMREIKRRTPTLAPTRVAILAALNLAEELFRVRDRCADAVHRTTNLMNLIDQKCAPQGKGALSSGPQGADAALTQETPVSVVQETMSELFKEGVR
jgi:cell division protein ZapA (FtsZ GTPase activity inhibitor)